MHRAFISTVVVTAITFTGLTSTVAQAGEYRYAPAPQHRTQGSVDPLAATIAGVAALVIIGKAIENNNRKATKPQKHIEVQRRPDPVIQQRADRRAAKRAEQRRAERRAARRAEQRRAERRAARRAEQRRAARRAERRHQRGFRYNTHRRSNW